MSRIIEIVKLAGKGVVNVAAMNLGIEAGIAEAREYRRLNHGPQRDNVECGMQAVTISFLQLIFPATVAAFREISHADDNAQTPNREFLVMAVALGYIPAALGVDLIVGVLETKQLLQSGNFQQFLESRAATSTALNTLSAGFARATRR